VWWAGDTVRYEGLHDVRARFSIKIAMLFLGAARVAAVGDANLTLTADRREDTRRG
jgi:hypothetical protein